MEMVDYLYDSQAFKKLDQFNWTDENIKIT